MKLRIWLLENRMTIKAFAEKINYQPGYIRDVITGSKKAGRKVAKIISEGTGGAITMADVFSFFT